MNKQRLLVVDDDPDYREVVVLYLSQDYDVAAAANVDEALALVDACRPDLVLLDLAMPGCSGLDFPGRLAREVPERADTPVVALTASRLDRLKVGELGKLKPLAGFIEKPYELATLRLEVSRFLSRAPEVMR